MILSEEGLDSENEALKGQIIAVTRNDVEKVLSEPAGVYSLKKLMVLISPAAENYLEQMAQIAHQLTIRRFGKTIRL